MTTIPESFYTSLKDRLIPKIKKDVNNLGCSEWMGEKKKRSNCGMIKLNFCTARKTVNAHKAVYIAFSGQFHLSHNISHLCHNGFCVNYHHLSHEPHSVNIDRERCRGAGRCYGHQFGEEQLRPCILPRQH